MPPSRSAGAERLGVVAMGKLGATELNYASDVDIVLVGHDAGSDEVRAARRLLAVAGRVWSVDTALRPEGRDGALVRTLDGYTSHWDRWAEPWELQALLKARAGRGRLRPGRGAHARRGRAPLVRTVVGRRPADGAAHEGPHRGLRLRVRSARAGAQAGARGIRDIEFATQLLQLVHGRHDPALRVRGTVPALAALADGGYVDGADAGWLRTGYRFLRRVEHALQLDGAGPTPGVPTDPIARQRLARTLGFRDQPHGRAVDDLDRELGACRATVRSIHERLYFRPLLEAFSGVDGPLRPDAAAERLAAFGFSDGDRTRRAVEELTQGLTRSSKLMLQLLPLVLDWLSTTPDPDGGLLLLRQLASGPTQALAMAAAFRESPETARRLAIVLGTSRKLGTQLVRNPDLIETVGGGDTFVRRRQDELVEAARGAVDLRTGTDHRRRALRRLTDREGLRIGAYDVLGLVEEVDGPPVVGPALSDLADRGARGRSRAGTAVGRLRRPRARPVRGAPSWPTRATSTCCSCTAGTDRRTRPRRSGPGPRCTSSSPATRRRRSSTTSTSTSGPKVATVPWSGRLEGYRAYFERWAQTWERQAMVRARPVAGDLALGQRLLDDLAPSVWAPLSDDDRRAIRRMKARIETERVPPGEDPAFHLKLGPGGLTDVEFCAQLLQLEHGIRTTGTIATLDALRAADVLSGDEADALVSAHRFCDRTRNRWFLVQGSRSDSLPTGEDLGRLAHSLGTTATDLRDQYRRVTRRARRVVESRFYGRA